MIHTGGSEDLRLRVDTPPASTGTLMAPGTTLPGPVAALKSRGPPLAETLPPRFGEEAAHLGLRRLRTLLGHDNEDLGQARAEGIPGAQRPPHRPRRLRPPGAGPPWCPRRAHSPEVTGRPRCAAVAAGPCGRGPPTVRCPGPRRPGGQDPHLLSPGRSAQASFTFHLLCRTGRAGASAV